MSDTDAKLERIAGLLVARQPMDAAIIARLDAIVVLLQQILATASKASSPTAEAACGKSVLFGSKAGR